MADNPHSRDWSLLHCDCLQKIAEKHREIPDLVRFSCVCGQWRRSAAKVPNFLPQKLPWVLLSSSFNTDNDSGSSRATCQFFSISENRTYAISLPKVTLHSPKIFTSPPHPWLLVVSHQVFGPEEFEPHYAEYYITLVNPITRSTISLPDLSVHMQCSFESFTVKILDAGSDLLVLFTHTQSRGVNICRLGKATEDLTWIRKLTAAPCSNADYVVHNGSLFLFAYSFEHGYKSQVFDATTFEFVSEVPMVWDHLSFGRSDFKFAKMPSGELLLVLAQTDNHPYPQMLAVFGLEAGEEGQIKWKKLSSIGDCFLFHSYRQALCLSSNDFDGYRRNCIYCLQDPVHYPPRRQEEVESEDEFVYCYNYLDDEGEEDFGYDEPNPIPEDDHKSKIYLFDIEKCKFEEVMLDSDVGRRGCLTLGDFFVPSLKGLQ